MPKDISSPFTPGLPVPVEFFIGRLNEIERLEKRISTATKGRLQVAFLSGERGIGKSSLASFVKYLSERDHRILGLHTFLGGVTSLEEMVRRVFDRLLKESIGTSWHEKVKRFFGDHIREVGLFGISVEFGAPDQDLKRMVHDFAPALRNLIEKVKDEKKGILLILDDINGLASSDAFANWLKSLVDEISTSQRPLPLCILLVGIEARRQSLIGLQPSLARVFEIVEIQSWNIEETSEFFKQSFSKVGITIEDGAMDILNKYTGGLPVLAHEIGDAAFNVDTDNIISRPDALSAVMIAADVVGRKHLQPQVFRSIRSSRYHVILRKIAHEPLKETFSRSEVLERLTKDELKVFDNFLRKLVELGVIAGDRERGRGWYRFSSRLHYLYFWLEASRAKEIPER